MNHSRFLLGLIMLVFSYSAFAQDPKTPADLRRVAQEYYNWRNQNYPVFSSDAGLHTWDQKLTDYSLSAVLMRRLQVKETLAKVRAMQTANWSKEDRIDWLLFRSQLDGTDFFNRVIDFEETDPQTYVNECSNGIFSLLKKEYDTPRNRALAATARLKQMPFLIEQGKGNLSKPVRLYAQLAIDSARSIDSLFNDSLMTLGKDLAPAEKSELIKARDAALVSIHGFADWLEKAAAGDGALQTDGRGELQLHAQKRFTCFQSTPSRLRCWARPSWPAIARSRRSCPTRRSADPNPARSKNIPADQQAFLAAYESRQAGDDRFFQDQPAGHHRAYLGRFEIRQLPEAFKPTSPGGFMNPPGVYDKDDSGFYFIPTYNPQSKNFYIRAAIEDPRPISVTKEFPAIFSSSRSRTTCNERDSPPARRRNLRRRLGALRRRDVDAHRPLSEQLPGQGQILRLSRYRAARIGVDVNLHTGSGLSNRRSTTSWRPADWIAKRRR